MPTIISLENEYVPTINQPAK